MACPSTMFAKPSSADAYRRVMTFTVADVLAHTMRVNFKWYASRKQVVSHLSESSAGISRAAGTHGAREAAGQAFYNTSRFTLSDLRARANRQQLTADFARHQPEPRPGAPRRRLGQASRPRQPRHGDDLRGAGAPLQFNEENNEEAGEHWTPRDAVRLMAKLVFLPIADRISSVPTSCTMEPQERMGGKRDRRFVIEHDGDPECSLVTRSSDGQMLFLANKLSKMR